MSWQRKMCRQTTLRSLMRLWHRYARVFTVEEPAWNLALIRLGVGAPPVHGIDLRETAPEPVVLAGSEGS